MNFKAYHLVADVAKSSKIKEKDDFQVKLREICQLINTKYSTDFLMPLKITQGINQIAGALKSIKHIYTIISFIEDQLYPQKIRFVLLHGELNSSTSKKDISYVYGSLLEKSQNRMDELKKTAFIFDLKSNSPNDSAVKWQMNLIFHIKSSWSLNKRRIIMEYGKLNNQQQVAELIGISQQAVSKNLNNSYFEDIKLIEADLNKNLKEYVVLEDIKLEEENQTLNKWFK